LMQNTSYKTFLFTTKKIFLYCLNIFGSGKSNVN
jgi:hypothetical protein